jgi:hypothetical protein
MSTYLTESAAHKSGGLSGHIFPHPGGDKKSRKIGMSDE